jgi:hypothetical protein
MDEKKQEELVPFAMGPTPGTAQPFEVLGDGEKTVTMVFPRPVLLTDNDGTKVAFHAGVQEVPEHLAGHEWLRRNGVTGYNAPAAKEAIDNAKSVEVAEQEYAASLQRLNAARAKKAQGDAVIGLMPAPEFAGTPLTDDQVDQEQKDADAATADAVAAQSVAQAEIDTAQSELEKAVAATDKAAADAKADAAAKARVKAEADAAAKKRGR